MFRPFAEIMTGAIASLAMAVRRNRNTRIEGFVLPTEDGRLHPDFIHSDEDAELFEAAVIEITHHIDHIQEVPFMNSSVNTAIIHTDGDLPVAALFDNGAQFGRFMADASMGEFAGLCNEAKVVLTMKYGSVDEVSIKRYSPAGWPIWDVRKINADGECAYHPRLSQLRDKAENPALPVTKHVFMALALKERTVRLVDPYHIDNEPTVAQRHAWDVGVEYGFAHELAYIASR